MADMRIIDTHVHLWNPERFRMPWLDDDPLLQRPHELELFSEHSRPLSIEAIVFVECGVAPEYAYLEARQAAAWAQSDPRLQGIVAAAPVDFGLRLRSYLDALMELGSTIKGVRRNLQDEKDLSVFLQPDFVRGVQLLAEYQLSFDLCLRHWQLPAATELVRRCPDTRFILDHSGKPEARAGLLDPWREHLRELAALPNVACKISGLVTEADRSSWQATDLAPYLAYTLEVFGENRVLFGGDWPVVLLASTYQRWVNTLQELTASLSEEAQQKLWHENARQIYRLASQC